MELEGHDVVVDEAWAIEAVQHGDSFLINQDKLGVLCESLNSCPLAWYLLFDSRLVRACAGHAKFLA